MQIYHVDWTRDAAFQPKVRFYTTDDRGYRQKPILLDAPEYAHFFAYKDAASILPPQAYGETGILYKGREVVKLVVESPDQVVAYRDAIGVENTFEADVPWARRLMVDHGISVTKPKRWVHVDIECDSTDRWPDETKAEERIFSISTTDQDGEERVFCEDDERKLLADFLLYLDTFPVWCTFYGNHFDEPYLRNRTSRLGMDFWWDNLLHIDLLAVYKFVLMKRQDRFGLDFLAEEEKLGLRKVPFDMSKIRTYFESDRETLKEYNLGDVRILRALDQKMHMTDIVFAIAEASHVTVRDMLRLHEKNFKEFNTSVPIDGLILTLSQQRTPRVVWPTKKRGERRPEDEEKFAGALVLAPKSGVHDNVVSLDVASLYPTLITLLNAGPDTYVTEEQKASLSDMDLIRSPVGRGWFRREPKSVIAEAVEKVREMRQKYKAVMKATHPASPEYSAAFAQDYAYKVLNNAIYGVIGASFSRYYVRDVAENITLTGQKVTAFLRDTLHGMGYDVVSGDTDSVFFTMPDMTIDGAKALADDLTLLAREYLKELSGADTDMFRLDVAELFSALLIPPMQKGRVPKKRYAGIVTWQGVPTAYLMVRGFELVRHDTSDAQKQAQREALLLLTTRAPAESLAAFVDIWWKRVDADDPDFNTRLVLHKGIAMELSEYKTGRTVSAVEHTEECDNSDEEGDCACPTVEKAYKVTLPMHIRVALKLAEEGRATLHKGDKVALIKTGPKPEDVLPVLPGDRISLNEAQRRFVFDAQFGKMFERLGIPVERRTVKRKAEKAKTTAGTTTEKRPRAARAKKHHDGTTVVVNVAKGEVQDVFIGRPSVWGNPFKVDRNGTREEVVAKYAKWILGQEKLLSRLPELKGKRLGCFCAPEPCHGDVLARLVEERV